MIADGSKDYIFSKIYSNYFITAFTGISKAILSNNIDDRQSHLVPDLTEMVLASLCNLEKGFCHYLDPRFPNTLPLLRPA